MPVPTNPPASEALVRDLLVASTTYDPAAVRSRLDLAARTLGLGGCLDEVLFPLLREIGHRWQHRRFDIEAERLATEAMRGWLESLALAVPEPGDAAPVLLTCGPADLHSIGIEALAVLLRHHGQPCRVLGARVPVRTLTTAVRATRPSGVVLVSHLRDNRLTATQALRAVAALGPEVFYAGGAFGSVRLRRNVPGTHLDGDLREACEVVLRTTDPGDVLG